jgi:hypothetical protein
MARFSNNPFPGVDAAQFSTWEKVTLPNGEVMYVVPGHPGYVYDPVASAASGRTVFRTNPKQAISQQEEEQRKQDEAEQLQKDQIKQQQFNQSPLGQIIPVAAGTGGIIAASQFAKPGVTAVGMGPNGSVLMSNGSVLNAGGAAAQGTTGTLAQSAATGATQAAAAPTVAGAEPLMSAVPEGFYGSNAATAAAPEAAGGILSNAAAMGPGPLAAIAAATYLGGKAGYDMIQGKKPGLPGRVVLGMATGGLSEVANGLGLFNHKSTREYAKERTDELAGIAPEDTGYQSYVSGMRDQYNAPPPDPSKPFAGKYGSWDEYKSAGLEAGDLTGVYGNIKAFGPEWAGLSQDDRVRVTQGLIDADLYESNKGDVLIRDEAKAKEIRDRILAEKVKQDALAAAMASGAQSGAKPMGRGANG